MKLLIAYYKFFKFILLSLGLILIFISSVVGFFGEEWLRRKVGGSWSFESPALGLLSGFSFVIVFLVFVSLERLYAQHVENKRNKPGR